MNLSFKKYHCLGRDFILLDNRNGALDTLQSADIATLSSRRFGIGASGVLRLDKVSKTQIEAKSFNFNGALAELNAMDAACVAVFAKDLTIPETVDNVVINGKSIHCKPMSEHKNLHFVNIRLLEPIVIKKSFQNFVMDLGSTFCMIPTDDVSNIHIVEKGREISYSKRFPKGANVTFYKPHSGFLEIRHYEHQVDQETYTNGLCAIGAALSHAQNNPKGENYAVRTKGGELQLTFARSEDAFYNVEIQALVNKVYEGQTAF